MTNAHGGTRPGAGRPRTEGERHNVKLPAHVWEWLKTSGNASLKIVELVENKMPDQIVEIIKYYAAHFFPVNDTTKVYRIPPKSRNWIAAIPPDSSRSQGEFMKESIEITHIVEIDFEYYGLGFGMKSNTLVIRDETPDGYNQQELERAVKIR